MSERPALDPYYRGETWREHQCLNCRRCWLIVAGPNRGRLGRCVYGGPFMGYALADPKDPPVGNVGTGADNQGLAAGQKDRLDPLKYLTGQG